MYKISRVCDILNWNIVFTYFQFNCEMFQFKKEYIYIYINFTRIYKQVELIKKLVNEK